MESYYVQVGRMDDGLDGSAGFLRPKAFQPRDGERNHHKALNNIPPFSYN